MADSVANFGHNKTKLAKKSMEKAIRIGCGINYESQRGQMQFKKRTLRAF